MIAARENDLYPSRLGGEARVLPRRDPVVWGEPGEGAPLDAEQRAAFERDGFLFLPGFFPPEVAAELRREGRALRQRPEVLGAPEVVLEPDSGQVRSVFRFHRFSAVLDRACREPRLLAIARHLLGDDVYLHQTRINYKDGFRGKDFYWHSDFETWHVEDGMPRMRAVSASVALTENNRFNGPLMVVPGSHRSYVACAGETPENHHESSLRKQEYGVPSDEHLEALVEAGGIEAPVGPPGSLLLFDCNTMHGSASNITPWPRCNLFVVFNSVSNRLTEPFGGTRPRPDHIGNRTDCAPLVSADA